MRKSFLRTGIASFIFVFLAAGPAGAGEPTEQIRQTTDRIITIVSDPALKDPARAKEKKDLIRKAVDERFDWHEMSRRTLARHWLQRTPQEKEEFVSLFGQLLERTYWNKVEDYSGEKVMYVGEEIDEDYAVVDVKVVTSKNTEVPVLYKLKKKGKDWMAYDIIIEGVSMVNNYRVQFGDIIAKSSYQGLVKKLKEKVEGKE
ncbi:MAG: ABC transporter substrate-binding protein [Desulfobacterales bacterium]|nr:ABC transporter substrate-binding protein [Desulfobacterales bacterium]